MDKLIFGNNKKIYDHLIESLRFNGYEIVRILYTNRGEKDYLQIMVERLDGKIITIDDCAAASHIISALLDVEDVIERQYELEVSSPGIDAPLTRYKDFQNAIGYEVKVSLDNIIEGQKNFTGELLKLEGNKITLFDRRKQQEIIIDLANINKAKLILNDKLLKESKL